MFSESDNTNNKVHYDYADWISNVSGRLLFRLANDPFNYRNDRIVGDIIHANYKYLLIKKRVLVISMLIDLRDEKIYNSSYRPYTRVIFLAHTLDEEKEGDRFKKKLYGDIFFITLPKPDNITDYKNNETYKKVVEAEQTYIKKLADLIKEYKPEFFATDEYKEKTSYVVLTQNLRKETLDFFSNIAEQEFDQVTQSSTKITCRIYHAYVCIKDTGFTYFKIDDNYRNNDRIKEILTQQAFYFIKYLFHKHVFHDAAQENITNIQPKQDGFYFAQKLISKLKHHISEIRNQKSDKPRYLHNLKGVISYTNSLLDDCRREKLINLSDPIQEQFYYLEKSYLQNIQDSLENALKRNPYQSSSILDFKNDLLSISIVTFALISPYFIATAKCETQDIFIYYTHMYSFAFACIMLFVILISFMIHGRDNYFTKIMLYPIAKLFKLIKTHNNITIQPRSMTSKICSLFVDIEMYIRRNEFKNKIAILTFIIIVSTLLMVFIIYQLLTKIFG
jgi:hypothetical protein